MKGDLSRDRFDPTLHYTAVRLQQGRMVTDADWNEQADLTRYRAERQGHDIIGACGVPLAGAGYALVAETNALAVHAVDDKSAWVAAEDGVLLHTTNGGADWALVDVKTAVHLRAVQQVGPVGWVVGDGGVVRRSSDEGRTWIVQDCGTLQALRGVSAISADQAWAVGDGGVVVATADGGAHWSLATTGVARLHAVRFIDERSGVAVGQGGAVVITHDGGLTWVRAASNTTAHLRALSRTDQPLGWAAAGQGGTIIRSNDGGVTWLQCRTPSTATLHAIGFRAKGEGWAAGEGGVVLHSTDGGESWTTQERAPTTAALRGLSCPSSGDTGWIVGDGSTALHLAAELRKVAQVALPAASLSILPGCCYVNGMLCELEERSSYVHQPDGAAAGRLEPGTHLVYLDAWQRHLSALEAPTLREIALGGPDTATRARSIAQVRALSLPAASPSGWNCDSSISAWDALVNAPRPRMAARAEPQLVTDNLCEIGSTAGYRRLENQLYRVEVHEGGAAPTFKWSRENGSVAYAVVSVIVDAAMQRTTVRVAARGRDTNLDLAAHDRVEIVDDEAELAHRAGALLEYLNDGDDELELVLAGVPTGTLGQHPARHPVLRRWDQKPATAGTHALALVEGKWIDLEDGVQVRFEPGGGVYRPGDYWQVPARAISSDVEWPRDDDGAPVARPPAGVSDAYCRLGIVEVGADGFVTVAGDCRNVFVPLMSLVQLLYVSGDGQEAAPGALLPQPLAVRVARGSVPVAGASVRFEVESGGGTVGPEGVLLRRSQKFETKTSQAGQAACTWVLGPLAGGPGRFHRVRVSLLDADRQALAGQVVVFCATASLWLQYVSGDGQQASPGAEVPTPLVVRVTNNGDGVAGIPLTVAVTQGGGKITGPGVVTTSQTGYASFGWQLGVSGAQQLVVQLNGSDGSELQRLGFTANVALAATVGKGGCDITVGPGGMVEGLNDNMLSGLLERSRRALCLCFLPGTHTVDGINTDGSSVARLSLHACGPTATLKVTGDISLSNFAAVELRDLVIKFSSGNKIELKDNTEVYLAGLTIQELEGMGKEEFLYVSNASRVQMRNCMVGARTPTSAIFEGIESECYISECGFEGAVSFYGRPETEQFNNLVELARSPLVTNLSGNEAQVHFVHNRVLRLNVSAEVVEQLLKKNPPKRVFQAAVLNGNVFGERGNVFVSEMLSFTSNSFVASLESGNIPYGVMVANRAAAAGNVAVSFDKSSVMYFLTRPGGFSGAANQVSTVPPS